MFEKQIQIQIGQNPGNSTSDDRARYVSQSIRRGRISREGALDVRESRERRDKIVPRFSPEKQKKTQFWPDFSRFLGAGSLVVREIRDRRDRISDKNSQKRRRFFFVSKIFFKNGCASLEIFIFLAAEKLTFGGGGYNFKTG